MTWHFIGPSNLITHYFGIKTVQFESQEYVENQTFRLEVDDGRNHFQLVGIGLTPVVLSAKLIISSVYRPWVGKNVRYDEPSLKQSYLV